MRVRPAGERAVLVECPDGTARATAAAARELTGVTEVVPAAATVLVVVSRPQLVPGVRAALLGMAAPDPGREPSGREVVLDVVYDGADLAGLAAELGLSTDALVARHTAEEWTSAFIGFAPGFAYLTGSGRLEVPRRAEPRVSVPPGSVGLAGPWSAVYPRASPGGWQLVGRTDAVVWDPGRTPPAALVPGTRVRFRPVRPEVRGGAGPAPRDATVPTMPTTPSVPTMPPVPTVPTTGGPPRGAHGSVEVLETGPLALVEDLGRPGLLDLGVPRSGALDRGAAVRANRLVGNPRDAAVVEVTFGGLVLRADGDLVVAVTGAPGDLEVRPGSDDDDDDDDDVVRPGRDRPFALPDGAVLAVGAPVVGVRTYVAVRGGLDSPVVLGSRSVDLLSGLGRPLDAGDRVRVGAPPGDAVAVVLGPPEVPGTARPCTVPGRSGRHARSGPDMVRVRVRPGPRADRLEPTGQEQRLTGRPWTVLDASNRVGLRLEGAPLRTLPGELASEGTVPGAVQVPPSGRPVVFLADHPVTGGYPVVAVVVEADLDLLAQVRPGEEVVLVEA